MKIAFVSTMSGSNWGGSEELWCGAALKMRNQGHQVFVSVYKWKVVPRKINELHSAGCLIHFRMLKQPLLRQFLEKTMHRMMHNAMTDSCIKWIKNISPDFVLISQGFPFEGIDFMLACRKLNIPYATVVQAASEFWWPPDSMLDNIRNAYGGASGSYFVSNVNCELVETQCGMRFNNSHIVNNPNNVKMNECPAWPDDNPYTNLACVGRLDPKTKGQDLLMEVIAMSKWRSRPIKVNFYGCGPCERSLRSVARMLNINNASFCGQVADIESIWTINHALVLPSRIEGLPLVIIEAMQCGRIVITTDVADNAKYITDGINGFVALAPTRRLLDDAMERAWLRRSEWQLIGANARRNILQSVPTDPICRFVELLT